MHTMKRNGRATRLQWNSSQTQLDYTTMRERRARKQIADYQPANCANAVAELGAHDSMIWHGLGQRSRYQFIHEAVADYRQ